MRRCFPLWALAFALINFHPAHASDLYSLPLPELVGPAPEYSGLPIEADFDFEREFEHVEQVLLLLEGHATPFSFEACGLMDDPQPCEFHSDYMGFIAFLFGPPLGGTWAVIDGFEDAPSLRVGVIDRPISSLSFDHLRDGRGTISLSWNGIGFIPELIVKNFVPPTGTISDAFLIIEAVPVPEPAPQLTAAVSLAVLALLRLAKPERN